MRSLIVKILKRKILVGPFRAIPALIKYPLRRRLFSPITRRLGLNIVKREEILNNSTKYHIFEFNFEESIIVGEPYNSSHDLPKSIINRKLTWEKPFLFEVANAELLGPVAVGFDDRRGMISETVPNLYLETYLPIQTLILKNLPSFGTSQLDIACSLVNWWSNNYFHWNVDCLTRLEGLEYYQEKTGIKPVLIIDSNPSTWQIESLRILGYEPDDCIRWNGSRLKVKQLVVPSFRRKSPAACKWLRQRMLSSLPDAESKKLSFSSRIYISRSKKVGRNVINEDEVLKALVPFGFVAYTLENMSFLDQVRLFSQAEIVVAPHGAGLTNIIFAKNLIVIELFSYGTRDYFTIAKTLGFHYACLNSEYSNGKKQYSNKFDPLMVDTIKLRSLVAEMLNIFGVQSVR